MARPAVEAAPLEAQLWAPTTTASTASTPTVVHSVKVLWL